MIVAFGVVLFSREPFGIDVLRERGALYQVAGDDIRNDYALKVSNRTQHAQHLQLSVDGPPGVAVRIAQPQTISIESGDVLNLPVELLVAHTQLPGPIVSVNFRVCGDGDDRCVTQTSHFFAPSDAQGPR